ncbi:MAG: Leucine aminopeptidase, partial [Candidatus Peregrinibacteria bacterium GW2011_GWA2_43_8]
MLFKTSVKIESADMLILPIYKSKTILAEIKKHLSKCNLQETTSAIDRKIFEGGFGQTLMLCNQKNGKYKIAILIGLGDEKKCDLHKIKKAGSMLAQPIEKTKSKTIAIINTKNDEGVWLAAAMILKGYKFDKYITNPKKKGHKLTSVTICDKNAKALAAKATELQTMVGATIYTRDLVNTTSNDMGPKNMVETAKKIAKEFKNIKINILDRSKLEKMGISISSFADKCELYDGSKGHLKNWLYGVKGCLLPIFDAVNVLVSIGLDHEGVYLEAVQCDFSKATRLKLSQSGT